MTCAEVAINGPDLKKLAQKKLNWHKKNQIGESRGERKKNPSANPARRQMVVQSWRQMVVQSW